VGFSVKGGRSGTYGTLLCILLVAAKVGGLGWKVEGICGV
jgi:hypothetical protein